jgi:hypothetical protein
VHSTEPLRLVAHTNYRIEFTSWPPAMSDRELLCSSPVYIRGLIRSNKTKWIKSWVVEYSSAVLMIKNSSKLEIFNGIIQNRDQWINMQVNILWSPVQQSLKEIEVLDVLAAIEFTTEAYPDTMLWGTKTLVQKKVQSSQQTKDRDRQDRVIWRKTWKTWTSFNLSRYLWQDCKSNNWRTDDLLNAARSDWNPTTKSKS